MSASDPREVLEETAADHPRASARAEGAETVWQVGATPFVVLLGKTAEFHLRPEMVSAALRTPGTRTSTRGAEWVAFEAPDEPERYDVDRMRAWFEMAARLVGG